ncbi:MAG: ATP-binding protein [Planctomycetota bacterium]
MFSRMLKPPRDKSFFLFGPRGTGKSWWVQATYPAAVYLDLLESELYARLLAAPGRLESYIPAGHQGRVVIDEVQKVPALLDEVHRLIESRGLKFVLTGSSARKLRRKGVNLLAGRALTHYLFPMTIQELGEAFSLEHALDFGCLPSVFSESDPRAYLSSYVSTYLREEVQQEGLTRDLGAFTRFLEAATFSQGSILNVSAVARECSVGRKVVEDYFGILDDLLLATRVPVFTKKARRKTVAHPKFYFYDTGVFRLLRPAGPLDAPEEIEGVALESLLFQELRALNAYGSLGYRIHYWRTRSGHEVDFVLYGPRGIRAIEIKRGERIRAADLRGLSAFLADYPMARALLLHGGSRRMVEGGVELVPLEEGLRALPDYL